MCISFEKLKSGEGTDGPSALREKDLITLHEIFLVIKPPQCKYFTTFTGINQGKFSSAESRFLPDRYRGMNRGILWDGKIFSWREGVFTDKISLNFNREYKDADYCQMSAM